MASSLVSEFSAVLVALEHLKELEVELKEEGAPLSPEASLHLRGISAAITELEAERRAARERLEAETTGNSELSRHISSLRERVSQEILADAAAARASGAEELRQLRRELGATAQARGAAEKRQEALAIQTQALRPELERARAERRDAVAALDLQIGRVVGLQTQLDHTGRRAEKLKTRLAAAERDRISLQGGGRQAREALAAEKGDLASQVERVEGKIWQQEQAIRVLGRELDGVLDRKREARDSLGELEVRLAKLESAASGRRASRRRREDQLQEEVRRRREMKQRRGALREELRGFGESLSAAVQLLKEDAVALEGKMEEGRATRSKGQTSLSETCEAFSCQSKEEGEVEAEREQVRRRLQRSTLQTEEMVARVVKRSEEIKEMEEQTEELREAFATSRHVSERDQEKLRGDLAAEKKLLAHFEEERGRLTRLLEETAEEQRDHVAKVTSDIRSSSRRHEELRREKAGIPQLQPVSAHPDPFTGRMDELEREHGRAEARCRREIRRRAAELEGMARSNQDKQREVEEKEELLKELEAKLNQEESRHRGLQTLSSELQRKRSDLEASIQRLAESTSSRIRPKEEMKAELGRLHAAYMDLLRRQASELKGVETSVRDGRAKLERVGAENGGLRLRVREMADEVARARRSQEACRQEIPRFQRDTGALAERIRDAWRQDLLLTRQSQGSDGALLASMSGLLRHLKTRGRQLAAVSRLLRRHARPL